MANAIITTIITPLYPPARHFWVKIIILLFYTARSFPKDKAKSRTTFHSTAITIANLFNYFTPAAPTAAPVPIVIKSTR